MPYLSSSFRLSIGSETSEDRIGVVSKHEDTSVRKTFGKEVFELIGLSRGMRPCQFRVHSQSMDHDETGDNM